MVHNSVSHTQAQYIFIHDAILEELVCGETQINPIDLKSAIGELCQQHMLTHTTGFEKQFNVGFAPNKKNSVETVALYTGQCLYIHTALAMLAQ